MNVQYDDLDSATDLAIEEQYADKFQARKTKVKKKRNVKERLDEHLEKKRARTRQRELDDFYQNL